MARVLQAAALLLLSSLGASQSIDCNPQEGTIYPFSFDALDEPRKINRADFKGKVMMVMNVATY